MKKSVLLGIVGLAAGVVTSYGQGYLCLDNYSTLGAGGEPAVVDGSNTPLGTTWTVGLYWAAGTTGLNQAAGNGLPDPSLTLGTGAGSTVGVAGPGSFSTPGYYSSIPAFNSGSIANTTLTLEVVVYEAGLTYLTSPIRGHSSAFSMPTSAATAATPNYSGDFQVGSIIVTPVAPVPEPTTLALAGLGGLASLVALRRKQA